jgi:hypothetical protein
MLEQHTSDPSPILIFLILHEAVSMEHPSQGSKQVDLCFYKGIEVALKVNL